MPVSAPALDAALAEAVGREHVLAGPAAAAAAVEGMAPRWLVRPGSAEAVGRVLALAAGEGLGVAPRGSGGHMDLGNRPRRLDLVLDLGRLSALRDHVPEDMVATVEAACPLEALAARLTGHRQMLALDPWGGRSRSVGGVLATGAAGPLRLRYGTGRDLLLGVRFVQADGTLTWGGARVVKSVSGYDIPKLLVGSLGTLGVLVEATLRLHPTPAAHGTWLVSLRSPGAAADLLAALLDTTLEPDRLALLAGGCARAAGAPDGGAAVLLSFGSLQEAVTEQGARVQALAAARGAECRPVPEGHWDTAGTALVGPVALRLACEPARVAHWTAEAEGRAAALGSTAAVAAEAGNGVLHVGLAPAPPALAGGLVGPLREGLAAEGGSLVVERAPAGLKAGLDVWGPVPAEALALMRRLKDALDPREILNPGRFVGGL